MNVYIQKKCTYKDGTDDKCFVVVVVVERAVAVFVLESGHSHMRVSGSIRPFFSLVPGADRLNSFDRHFHPAFNCQSSYFNLQQRICQHVSIET